MSARARRIATVTATAIIVSLVPAAVVHADPAPSSQAMDQPVADVGKPVDGTSTNGKPPQFTATTSSVSAPSGALASGTYDVDVDGAPASAAGADPNSSKGPAQTAGKSGVTLAQKGTSKKKIHLQIKAGKDSAPATGPLLALTADGGVPATDVGIPLAALDASYGGDYASRVTWTGYELTADGKQGKAVTVGQTTSGKTSMLAVPASSNGVMLVAQATSTSTSGTGSFAATNLIPSSTYKVATQTGAFTWSYPITAPAPAAGSAPSVALSYDSGLVDGETGSTNNQPSAIGDGWHLDGAGFIERSYSPCTKDPAGAQQTGDLCWNSDNATIQFGAHSGQIIRDSATGTWRLQSDDGSRIEKFTGAGNGDNDGEYWVITTTDGTKYYFGLNQLPGYAAGKETTNSTWTVPVFGNQAGEPCHGATFAASSCSQAWRWNLDYVVDTHGNSAAYYYTTESNKYASNLTDANGADYIRGGQLARIDYGMRAGAELSTPAPYRIVFDSAPRCIPGSTCTSSTPADWPDVPWDQNCTAAPCTGKYSPTFWVTTRISSIRTLYNTGGSNYGELDQWVLTHSFPAPGDGTSAALWLASISHIGKEGGSTITLPDVQFSGTTMANRVWATDGLAPLVKWRIAGIKTETGAVIAIAYSGADCTPTSLPANAETNNRRCFPQWWNNGTSPARLDYFHKYVVTEVSANPGYGNAIQDTKYTYTGTPAWLYQDSPLIPDTDQTWSVYAGYDTVSVTTGDGALPGSMERTDYHFYRGIDGDRASPSGGTKTSTVTTSDGAVSPDSRWLAGQTAEAQTFNGSTGPLAAKTISTLWASSPTATNGTKTARYVRPATSSTYTSITGGNPRVTKVSDTYDTAGRLTLANDQGDLSITTDDLCTTTSYAINTTTNLALPAEVTTTSKACGSTTTPADVVSSTRKYYDSTTTVGAAPTIGDTTKIETAKDIVNGALHYVAATGTFDALGRPTSATDALGRTTSTAYTPSTGGVTTSVVTTNPKGWTSTTTLDPGRGSVVKQLDVAGRVTEATYDALGRTSAVWLPGRDRSSGATASMQYAYTLTAGQPPAIATTTLTPSGSTTTSYTIYDALLKPRQTQTPSEGGGIVITDSFTDAAGRTVKTNGAYYAQGTPSTTLFQPSTVVPGVTVTAYDGLDRPTSQTFVRLNQNAWATTYSYDGASVTTTPPTGAPPTTKFIDARGNTTALWTYKNGAPSGDHDTLTYTNTPAGKIASLTDNAGNKWTWTYNQAGEQSAISDPDVGTTTATYDDAGNLTASTDARGVTLSTTYDELNRKTALFNGPAQTGTKLISYAYDAAMKGQPDGSTVYDGTDAYVNTVTGYTPAGLPTGTTTTIPASAGALAGDYQTSYTYTANNLVASVTDPAAGGLPAETVTTSYSDLSNPTAVAGASQYVKKVVYTHLGEIAQIGQVGAAGTSTMFYHSYYYDDGSRRLTRALITTYNTTAADRNYTYDQSGQTTSITDKASATVGGTDTQCFTDDYAQRLTQAWTPADSNCATAAAQAVLGGPAAYRQTYGYDNAGDRSSVTNQIGATATATQTTYAYPAAGAAHPHALSSTTTGTTTSTYGYDASGNTTTATPGPTGNATYTYNPRGLMSTASIGPASQSNVYDAAGQLLLRREGGTTTIYLGDTEATLDGTGKITGTRTYTGAGKTIATRTGDATSNKLTWLDTDTLGTAGMSQDPTTGAVTKRYFDPFGNNRTATAPTWPTNHGLLDKPTSTTTALSRFGVRDYDPLTGRFQTVDPILRSNRLGPYAYSNNDPINNADPTGLTACKVLPWEDKISCENGPGQGASRGEWDPSGNGNIVNPSFDRTCATFWGSCGFYFNMPPKPAPPKQPQSKDKATNPGKSAPKAAPKAPPKAPKPPEKPKPQPAYPKIKDPNVGQPDPPSTSTSTVKLNCDFWDISCGNAQMSEYTQKDAYTLGYVAYKVLDGSLVAGSAYGVVGDYALLGTPEGWLFIGLAVWYWFKYGDNILDGVK